MRSYEVARKYFSAVELCGWITIVVGVLTMLVLGLIGQGVARGLGGPTAGSGLLGLFPGLMIAMIGLISIGMAQYWRAGVDTAEYTQQMLKIARDQLEVSQQALSNGRPAPNGFAALRVEAPEQASSSFAKAANGTELMPARSQRESILSEKLDDIAGTLKSKQLTSLRKPTRPEIIQYNGTHIEFRDDLFWIGDQRFESRDSAERFVDKKMKR